MKSTVKRKSGGCSSIFLLLVLIQLVSNFNNGVAAFSRSSNKVNRVEKPKDAPPTVGAFRKNFKGEVAKVITQVPNSETTLPLLRYEDHTWEGHSIELECNATYPVQWIYSGVGVSI